MTEKRLCSAGEHDFFTVRHLWSYLGFGWSLACRKCGTIVRLEL